MWLAIAIATPSGAPLAHVVRRPVGLSWVDGGKLQRACRLAACLTQGEEGKHILDPVAMKLSNNDRLYMTSEEVGKGRVILLLVYGPEQTQGVESITEAQIHQFAAICFARTIMELKKLVLNDPLIGVELQRAISKSIETDKSSSDSYDFSSAVAIQDDPWAGLASLARFQDWTLEKVVRMGGPMHKDYLGTGVACGVIVLNTDSFNSPVLISTVQDYLEESVEVSRLSQMFSAACASGNISLFREAYPQVWTSLCTSRVSTSVTIMATHFAVHRGDGWTCIIRLKDAASGYTIAEDRISDLLEPLLEQGLIARVKGARDSKKEDAKRNPLEA